ncbi:acetate--CoA ligase family protein [Halorussus salinisoli]|uniref:acetate--CoA ligase family protein n=1 Tax=Halorussus salinisoli TaxID=2558242 RepID=UPI0010C1DC25|nr:acetate--CoA ligase family protein [Halorussus salinisoli]
MTKESAALGSLFSPETIAVVGASPDSFYSSNLVSNLLNYGFDGTLYPVNPGREEVWNRTCYNSLEEVPDDPDLVVVSVPREYVIDVVHTAGKRGVPAALVITAGFSEADETGEKLAAKLADVIGQYDIRVTGPNCIGVANARDGVVLTSTCSRKPESGSIGLVSQSGALAFTTFFERATDEDISFSHIVSTGNEIDLSVSDYVSYLADQSSTEAICTYIEGISNPRRFVSVADDATRSGTPVLAVKVGRSETAEAATLSHTGSVTGSDAAWDGAFAQSGVQRVPDIPDLLSRANAHANFDPPSGSNVCIASTSGGLASLLADMAAEHDLELPDITGSTERDLLEMDDLLTFGEMHNPADIRGYGAEVLPAITDTLFADDAFDAYVFALGLSAVDERAERVADDLLQIADRADDPVFVLWTGRKEPHDSSPERLPFERLREEVPVYYDPARCMDAVASLVEFGQTQEHLADRPRRRALEDRVSEAEFDLSEDTVLTWSESEKLLDAYDVPTVETRLVTDPEAAADAATDLGFPVVLKVDSSALPHRSDADAVRVGIETREAAADAYREIVSNACERVDEASIEGVLVQPMVEDGVEALVGVSTDELFGPLVTVGPGGVLVELLEDQAVRVPPLSDLDAEDAIASTQLGSLLSERRDGSPIPATELADLLVRVGDLAVEVEDVAELDLNPIIVTEEGAVAVDALLRTK